MGLAEFFIFLVIFGIVGYAINKIWDFNPYEYWEKFGVISIIISLVIAYLPTIFNPQDVVNNVDRIMNWFVAILPGTIIGDLAGQIISKITGGGRR
ncbi:hypothetical protein FJZ19_00720 [Candidatus Pacearchaeota archaeon]|nr:hypothetical protein [Candidatus Pacearchaeota archaeon]